MRSFRFERRVLIAASVLALFGAGPVSAAAPVLPPAFPDGTWEGQSVYGGPISKPGLMAVGTGDVKFDLTVSNGNVADGTMIMEFSGTSGSAVDIAMITLKGTLALSGTSAFVEFSGPVSMTGEATSHGYLVPIDFSGPTNGALSPGYVTCDLVTGDLATEARDIQQSLGFATGVTGLFVAIRTGDSPATADAVVEEYNALADAMADLLGTDPSPDQILEMAAQYEALAAKVAAISACESLPPGFISGLSDKGIGALFQHVLQKALDNPGAYTAQQLLSLLASGVRMGCVGDSVPGSGAYQDSAANLLVQFETTLEAKLNAADAAGDLQTVQDIWIAAQQLGLDALAEKAKKLWATDN